MYAFDNPEESEQPEQTAEETDEFAASLNETSSDETQAASSVLSEDSVEQPLPSQSTTEAKATGGASSGLIAGLSALAVVALIASGLNLPSLCCARPFECCDYYIST